MTFGARLKTARKNIRMTQDDLSAALNSARPTISAWENDVYLPGTENITALARVLGVTVAYLLGETGASQPIENGENEAFSLHDNNIIKLRIFPAETAASFDETTNLDDVVVKEEGLINYVFVDKRYLTTSSCDRLQDHYCITLWDNSMQGAQMAKGQIAIVKGTSQVESGEAMFVSYNGHAFFRWLITKQDGTVELRPANPDFRSEFITLGDGEGFAVKGVVVGVLNAPYAPQKAF